MDREAQAFLEKAAKKAAKKALKETASEKIDLAIAVVEEEAVARKKERGAFKTARAVAAALQKVEKSAAKKDAAKTAAKKDTAIKDNGQCHSDCCYWKEDGPPYSSCCRWNE